MQHNYLIALREILEANFHAQNAQQMERYMKGHFEFYGLKQAPRRNLFKTYMKENPLPDETELISIVEEMWEQPQREFQYCGIELLMKFKKTWKKSLIETLEFMIVTKSWWDTVDYIAGHLVGVYFQKFPEQTDAIIAMWVRSDNIWLNRVAIIFQLKYKENTNEKLLFDCCKRHLGSKEFFIQKAIGWALRQHTKINPEVVIDFVENHKLAPLSKREALRLL